MRGKKRIGLLFLLIAVVVGGGGLLLAQKALHKTSDTAFCLSCHSMSKPFEEYQGTVHFSNQKGIRAECADYHIPKSGMDYLFAKLKASKDIYHEFVSGKIDSDDKFEAHRQEMAETVWKELKQLTLQPAVVAILLMPWILPRKVNLRRKCIIKRKRTLKRVSIAIKALPISRQK
ncbi:cytochrome C-type protein [Escherichia coli]|uniref:Cytochrome C-type protein n=1 Tax=Escherichia coli TaxID=562 RepID=A0A376VUP0_ECOLX|nr:cytochrome C-type protein [Escherichia coli]